MLDKLNLSRTQSATILIVLMAVGLGLRLYKINDHAIWMDERTTIRSAVGLKDFKQTYVTSVYEHVPSEELKQRDDILNKHPFTSADYWKYNTLHNVVNSVIYDNSNSLAYVIPLHYWVEIFGPTDVSGRAFSILFGMLTMLLAYFFATRFLGNPVYGLIIVALLVFDCWLINNCQLLRTYAFTTFFVFLNTVLFFNIIFKQKGGWVYPLYCITALISLGGHHMTLYIFVCQALIALLYLRDKSAWVKLVLCAIPVVIIYGLWIGKWGAAGMEILHWKNVAFAERVKQNPNLPFPGAASPKNLFGGIVNYLNMIMGTHLLYFGLRIFMVMGLLLIPFGLCAIVYLKAADSVTRKLMVSLLLLIFAAPLFSAIMAVRSHNAVPFTIFYAAYAVPFGAFLLVLCISRIPFLQKPYKQVATGLVLGQVALILISFPTSYKELLNNYHIPSPHIQIAEQTKQQYQVGDTLLSPTWQDAQLVSLYLKDRPDIVQDVDLSLLDKVVLSKHGERKQLYDFKMDNIYSFWPMQSVITLPPDAVK